MGFKGAERGAAHIYIRKTAIEDFDVWKGLRLDGDPASLNVNELRVAENVRLMEDDVICRGGQAPIEGLGALTGVPSGIWQPDPELLAGTTPKLFLTDGQAPNGSQPGVYRYDPVLSVNPVLIQGSVIGTGTAVLGRTLYYALRVTGTPRTVTVKRCDIASTTEATAFVFTFLDDLDAGLFLAGAAQGKIWFVYGWSGWNSDEGIGFENPSNGRVYSYDGIALVEEHRFSFADTGNGLFFQAGGFCPYQDGWLWAPANQTYPGFSLMVRDRHGSLGFHPFDTTSDPDLTPSTLSQRGLTPWSEYSRAVYIGGSGTSATFSGTVPVIWRTTGGAPHIVHRIDARGTASSCISFDGYLYYLWQATSPAAVNIGRYDGTTWDDDFTTVAGITSAVGLAPMGGNVYLFGIGTVGLRRSTGVDLTTWTVIENTHGRQYGNPSSYSRYG